MPPRVLVLDNHDSFTWNLVQCLSELGAAVSVEASDAVAVDAVAAAPPDALVISPGPGTPADAGASAALVARLSGRVPILGVCLGHQVVATVFGARVVRAARPMHGKTSAVRHDGRGCFRGLPSPLTAMRYHSLLVDETSLPAEIEAAAWTADGEVMALRHRRHPTQGVQFHPESIGTPDGKALLANVLADVAAHAARRAA